MTNKNLPCNPDNMIALIRSAENPGSLAHYFSRELMLLTKTDRKNYWYEAEANLLMMILLYVATADSFVPLSHPAKKSGATESDRSAREVANYICSPKILNERIEKALAADPYNDGELLRNNYLTWVGTHKRVSDTVAASLAAKSEVVEYLLGKTEGLNNTDMTDVKKANTQFRQGGTATMKKELDPNIYSTTLGFLDDRIAIYRQMADAAKTPDVKKSQEQFITDCENMKEVLLASFVPRKRRTGKEQADE